MTRILELQKRIKDTMGEAEAIRKAYVNTADPMSEEDSAKFDAAIEAVEKLEVDLAREKKAAKMADALGAVEGGMVHPTAEVKAAPSEKIADIKKKAFNAYLSGDTNQFKSFEAEAKGLNATLDTYGGYLVVPEEFMTELLKEIDNDVFIRRAARKFTLRTAESLGTPSLDADVEDSDWTAELATGGLDNSLRFGKRALTPHPLAKRVKISNTLMRLAVLDPEVLVRERLAYKFGVTEEKAFLTGTGANQPLGVFTVSAQGINTDRDVTSASSADFTADVLLDATYHLKDGYRRNARWMIHRDGVKKIRKLKDGNGQFLWQPGIAGGEPGSICDLPFITSEYAPNTFTASQYVAILGDWSYYWIADALNMTVQRVSELYAETNETGFIARAEFDGAPMLSAAFARVKLGA